MHELAIAQELMALLMQQAADAHASAIEKVVLQVGDLSGVAPDSLEFCFEIAAKGTPAENARLIIEHVPANIHCNACGQDAQPEFFSMFCPNCGSLDTDLTEGRELLIRRIEVVCDV